MGDLTAYKVGAHRHVPEIKQATGVTSLTMTPVLAPMPRGILAVRHAAARATAPTADEVARGARAPPTPTSRSCTSCRDGQQPHTAADRRLATARTCRPSSTSTPAGSIVTSAIDNLGKGAAGQALQNANLMLGLPETAGLAVDGVAP